MQHLEAIIWTRSQSLFPCILLMKYLKIDTHSVEAGDRKLTLTQPVTGFAFCSIARSLDASCHSLVREGGGGAADGERVKCDTM